MRKKLCLRVGRALFFLQASMSYTHKATTAADRRTVEGAMLLLRSILDKK